ncbi:MAG: alpha-amylase family glycosyl hydrolase [Verrucomicrobiaceae bacterium]
MPSSLSLVQNDSWLEPVAPVVEGRHQRYLDVLQQIESNAGTLLDHAAGHHYFGLHRDDNGWTIREWAPAAHDVFLVGDFNDWNNTSHPLVKDEQGVWILSLPAESLAHEQRYKLHIHGADGSWLHRIPAYASRVVQDDRTKDFSAQVWSPENTYQWQHDFTYDRSTVRIYEAHVGIAGEEGRVHSYREFADNTLPRIAKQGYNVIQLMAIAEHPYYGSFGYHVSSFFAPSSRFGTPEELKYLIDTAHGLGIAVLIDIVHSHSVKNTAEGLSRFDGSDGLYFHGDARGEHPQWDSKVFDYGRDEVRQFLLSNLRYWLEVFRFDGFRFDGVTSMLYWHRGTEAFGSHHSYFGPAVDDDAILYLKLATKLIHTLRPDAIVVAEDMSGMPGLCRPIDEGGQGFTHRLSMGLPDYWIKLLKHTPDEHWNMDELWDVLTNRKYGEANIAYAESHDQALVGDKTLAFHLMDEEMYWHMGRDTESLGIDRGIALHKIIRLLTLSFGGEGWLNFIGNEFGHPEWLDFPREGNGWSYHYCRRQWSLADNPALRYSDLNEFDRALQSFAGAHDIMGEAHLELLFIHNDWKIIVARRGPYLCAFNLNPYRSFPDLEIPVWESGEYKVLLDTERPQFGGHDRIDPKVTYLAHERQIRLYLPTRTGLILQKK